MIGQAVFVFATKVKPKLSKRFDILYRQQSIYITWFKTELRTKTLQKKDQFEIIEMIPQVNHSQFHDSTVFLKPF